jgi:hypothetical protein
MENERAQTTFSSCLGSYVLDFDTFSNPSAKSLRVGSGLSASDEGIELEGKSAPLQDCKARLPGRIQVSLLSAPSRRVSWQ